jgi:hypothetical protein
MSLATVGLFSVVKLAASFCQQWTFDGDVPGAKVEGRVEYRESAVGGKALVFNGVDTRLTIPAPVPSFGLWFFAADPGPMTLAGALTLERDGALKLGAVKTAPRLWYPGQWVHVAVLPAGLYVNGERVAEAGVPLEGDLAVGGAGKTAFRGLIDDLRVHDPLKGLEALPWYRPRPWMAEPFAGTFELRVGDTVAFVGGEGMLGSAGFLEEQLASKGVRFRTLAWEGDTVFERRRDVNFGPLGRSLARAGASVVVVQFGQMESLKGDVDAFRSAYDKLLGEIQERTKRIVILAPTPFGPGPGPDPKPRNEGLARYVDACKELAARRQALFVALPAVPTRDGVHPTDAGHAALAGAVARALGFEEKPVPTDVRRSIREKNRLWFDFWRPMNWAFLEGDRDEQPFSRDPRDNRVRGLAIEMQDFLPLIRRLEDR